MLHEKEKILKKQAMSEKTICQFINGYPNMLLDIGVGPKSEYQSLGEMYPQMRMVGLEPSTARFKSLLRKFTGVLLPYAAWDSIGKISLYSRTNNAEKCDAPSCFQNSKHKYQEVVEARTLDWLESQIYFPSRTLLWMDIEGSELRALKGSDKLLCSGKISWINLEVSSIRRWEGACLEGEVTEFLKQYGYKKKLEYDRHKDFWDVIYVKV